VGGPPESFYSADVEVTSVDLASFADLEPLLDDLTKKFMKVTATRWGMRPPMAGSLDVAITLFVAAGAVGSIEFVRKFAGLLAEDAYKSVRDALRRLRDKAQEEDSARTWTLAVQIGSHRFYFRGPFDEEEFVARLGAADPILRESPPELIEHTDGAPREMEGGWYWDPERKAWRATPALEEAMRRGQG
jgi:hypothetical protein